MDNHFKARIAIQARRDRQRQEREARDRQFIQDRVRKDMMTLAIGAIVLLEDELGGLWGHNKSGALTEEESQYRQRWHFIRNEILDSVNEKIGRINGILDSFTVTYSKGNTNG